MFSMNTMNNILVNNANMNNVSYILWWHHFHKIHNLISPSLISHTHYSPSLTNWDNQCGDYVVNHLNVVYETCVNISKSSIITLLKATSNL